MAGAKAGNQELKFRSPAWVVVAGMGGEAAALPPEPAALLGPALEGIWSQEPEPGIKCRCTEVIL